MKISIAGTGYVGLVTGAGLASLGHQVICVDIDKNKIEKINRGQSPIYEKGLDVLLKTIINKKLLSATDNLDFAVKNTEITFIAVPTPSKKNNSIDLSYIKKISKDIGKALAKKTDYHLVAVKSTVAPETTFKTVLPLIERFSQKKAGKGFGLCMNPEFLREGDALDDFLSPDRIVIGQLDKKSGDILEKVYKNFKTDILKTSLNNAEMIKYANNALFSCLISFSNEIANICEKIPGADAFEVLKGVHLDKRLNPVLNKKRANPQILTYLAPGCGFGGSCFPKDVKALVSFSKNKGYNPELLSAILSINKNQPLRLVNLTEEKIGNLQNKKIAVLGLSFKPDTDDIRESAGIPIIKELIAKGAVFSVYDPLANQQEAKKHFKGFDIKFSDSLDKILKDKDACLLVTGWNEFKKITPKLLLKNCPNVALIDGRGFFNKKDFSKKINYSSIGLGVKKK